MAISDLLPRKAMGSKSRSQTLHDRLDYDQKEEKTKGGELVSSYMCSPETAAEEFEISKKLYAQLTGRSQSEKHDIIMYRIIQSFKPDEVSPEEAHKIGCELAMKFTGGQHQFVVATHTDKRHIHTHIEFNSTNLNCDAKFQNVKNSAFILRRMNDELCRAHGLSVIENPKKKAKSQKEMAAAQYGISHKKQLQQTIDKVLPECNHYEEFLAKMRAEGYEVVDGKNPGFRLPGWERPARVNRLGGDYTKTALRARITSQRGRLAAGKTAPKRTGRKVNLLIDIQAKLAAGKGAGYERWAKIFNLKEAAKTLNFLMENGLADYDELALRAAQAEDGFNAASQKIKQLEARMAGVAKLKHTSSSIPKRGKSTRLIRSPATRKNFSRSMARRLPSMKPRRKPLTLWTARPFPKWRSFQRNMPRCWKKNGNSTNSTRRCGRI